MTDRPGDGWRGQPPADDGQWRPVDPPTEAGPYQPNPYPQGGPYQQGGPGPQGYPPTQAFDPYGSPGLVYGGPAYPPPEAPYPYGEPAPAGGPPPDGGGDPSRTLWLVAAVVALILVVALVAGYFLVTQSDGEDDTVAASTSSIVPSTDNLFPTFDDPSQSPGGSQPSASAAPGQVLYQLSGNGQVLGVTYASGTTLKVSPTLITPPWSVAATVDSDPSLIAIVVSGSVTCTISRDGQVLTTATSSAGILRCAAPAG